MSAKTMKIDDVQYTKRDVLEVELDIVPTHLVTQFGELRGGKQRLKLLGEAIKGFMDQYVQDEEERQSIESLKRDFEKRKKKLETKLQDEVNNQKLSQEEMDEQLSLFVRNENYYKSFYAAEGKDPKPIRSLKVIENHGPEATDLQAKQDRDRELTEAMLTVLKQNSHLFEKLVQQSPTK